MPIFEYECQNCDHHFEALVFGQKEPACPSCESKDLKKTLSVFAVATGGKKLSAQESFGPCGTCGDPRGPGACSLN